MVDVGSGGVSGAVGRPRPRARASGRPAVSGAGCPELRSGGDKLPDSSKRASVCRRRLDGEVRRAMRHLLVGLASAALASACAWPYGYCLRTPEEWKGWSEASFAHVEIHASRVDGLEPRGFDAALARLLGAAVGHSDWKYGAIYWANLDAPREFDLAALHELRREWGTRGVRHPQVYLFAAWVFAGKRATCGRHGTDVSDRLVPRRRPRSLRLARHLADRRR